MNVTLQIQLENSLLKNIAKNGLFPDSLENILILRVQDVLRKHSIQYEEIGHSVTRSSGLLFSLYEVDVTIKQIKFDIGQLKTIFTNCLSPFVEQIKKVNMIIH